MSIPLNMNSIITYLKDQGFAPELQEEHNQIHLVLKGKHSNVDFPVFIRALNDGFLLNMLVYFPFEPKQAAAPDVARLLHLLNRELDVPGFCLDEASSLIFFRCVIPSHEGRVKAGHISAFLETLRKVSETFFDGIAEVATAKMTFDEVLIKAQEFGKNRIRTPPTP